MKRPPLYCAALLAAAIVMAPAAHAQQPSQADMDAMMKKMQEAGAPGDAHKFLNQFVGSWETTMRMQMGPGAPPMESKGVSEVRWILDGRFLEENSTGTAMGMPHNGRGMTGYDNMRKKYTGFWADNMGTAMFTMEGTLDQTGKVLTYFGSMDEPLTGEMGKTVKYVLRIVDPDTHTFEIHDLHIVPGETKVVEITYRRKK